MWIPGWGEALCAGTTRAGTPCTNFEVEGLGKCLHHVDDDHLAEAEAIMGFQRCHHPSGCRYYAVAGSIPARCKVHGCNQGSAQRRNADLNARAMEIIQEALGGPRKHRRKRLVPLKATWRSVT
jgi:hypothetical protein